MSSFRNIFMPLNVNERVKLVVWVGCLCIVMWVLYAKLTGVKEPFSYGRWDFCQDMDAKFAVWGGNVQERFDLVTAPVQDWNVHRTNNAEDKASLCVKQHHRLYISRFRAVFFSILHKLLDHNKLNQECLWKKLINTPAWMNLVPPKKKVKWCPRCLFR